MCECVGKNFVPISNRATGPYLNSPLNNNNNNEIIIVAKVCDYKLYIF